MSDYISQEIGIHGEGNIVVGKGDVVVNPLPPAEARLRADLGILLRNVQNTWIKGVLDKSVHEAALLELGMELREDYVDNPWHMVLERPDQSREVLPRGRKIKDIFDEANRLLLILGEPGSGKTTTLLQLARDLIAEVDHSFTRPVPVILNLSTWTNKQQPLDKWLIAELNSKYFLPKKQGKLWLQDRRILPLLDGLDEVKAESRAACVEKLNKLVVDYGLQGLVICSRLKEYTELNVRLSLYRAIYLQPLTSDQVREYLGRAGDKLSNLLRTLESDDFLQSMARSPLILNIMSLAYKNISAEALSEPSLVTDKARQQRLFDTYITRMFHRKGISRPYENERTKRHLSWLAQNMQYHNQDVFLIEDLQPSWLQAGYWQWLYFLVSRVIIGLIVVPVITSGWFDNIGTRLIAGIISGITFGFLDIFIYGWLRKRQGGITFSSSKWTLINVIVKVLTAAVIMGLTVGLFANDLVTGLLAGLDTGPIFGLLLALKNSGQSIDADIETIDALHWSGRKSFTGCLSWGLAGLGIGLAFAVTFALLIASGQISKVFYLETIILSTIIQFGMLGAVLGGLRGKIVQAKSSPNQGIRLSVRNAFLGATIIVLCLTIGLALTNLVLGNYTLSDVPSKALYGGLTYGLLGFLWYGGLAIIKHYILRLLLVIQRHTPGDYARFLNSAVDRIFLQKVGGGYRFIHRLLLEHFADMLGKKA